MKSFQRRVQDWVSLLASDRQKRALSSLWDPTTPGPGKTTSESATEWFPRFKQLQNSLSQFVCSTPKGRKAPCPRSASSVALFTLAVVSLSSTIGYRLYNEPQLAVGTTSPRTLRAPDFATVFDSETTEEKRQSAKIGAVPVLRIDTDVNQRIYQRIQQLMDEGDALRLKAGAFPFVSPTILSTSTQQYLRQTHEPEWKAILTQVEGNSNAVVIEDSSTPQALAVVELQSYRRYTSADDYSALKQTIQRSREAYASASATFVSEPPAQDAFLSPQLLDLPDITWLGAKSTARQIVERMLTQGIPPGLPSNLLEQAVTFQVQEVLPPEAAPIVKQMLLTTLEANLIQDPEQTRQLAEKAAREVEPVMVSVRRGEIIVEAGQPITQREFVLLDHFGMSERVIDWVGVIGFGSLVAGGIGVFLLVERRFHPGLRRRDYGLVTLLTLTTPLVATAGIAATSLPLVGLLVGSFYGSALGATVVALLGTGLAIGMDLGGRHLAASVIASLLGAMMAGRLRSREELALLGGAVGLTQGVTYLIMSLIVSPWSAPIFYSVLAVSATQALMGVAWSIAALGLSPYLEQLFDLVTPIRLAELSNPNRPLLKRLASEAPGTFQHTLFVATLAEAAARKLGCNVELVRAGTLYHDIGKMHDPLGFIENQMGGPNKHDLINDPWKSADIIKKHVTLGMAMAKKYRLPKAVRTFIPEHQGSMVIAYFYHQAQERAKANPKLVVKESDFKYDGPSPQSRETGIVMLADSCEAALRSLKDATPTEALAMVNRILKARWQDKQLANSGLLREEMPMIADVFVKVWQEYNHQRIAYPKAPLPIQAPSVAR
ncbi:HDIG domain-containing metalloprotein [Leptolyngbya sp. FACHB-8]|uniref:HD family phosphohydrolase n=1 Tax=unclassified Leptolyngbya TaxID=2650499 RepID=UPI0016894EEF|nr:HDIG domain-containing metalloprotein [Leptolyngbya sp. FACHB-8]MBD1910443.1 HDIG domain-containing protein [Leptolyngbya sp. FACHB-8]